MFWSITSILFPVFGIVLFGFFCGRWNLLGDRAFEVLNRFVITITLPILTFRAIAHMDVRSVAQPGMFAAITLGALATYAIGFAIEKAQGRSLADSNIAALCACFSNCGFVGLPIAMLVFGQDSLPPVAVAMLIYSSIVFTLGLLIAEIAADSSQGWKAGVKLALRAIVRTPLIMLAVAGVLWSASGIPLGGPMDVLLETMAQATAPCALTAIGIFISMPRQEAEAGPIARVVALKLLAQPLITAGILLALPPIPPLWAKVAILMAAMPGGASSFVLAGRAGRRAMELSSWAVVLTTLFAPLTLLPVLWFVSR